MKRIHPVLGSGILIFSVFVFFFPIPRCFFRSGSYRRHDSIRENLAAFFPSSLVLLLCTESELLWYQTPSLHGQRMMARYLGNKKRSRKQTKDQRPRQEKEVKATGKCRAPVHPEAQRITTCETEKALYCRYSITKQQKQKQEQGKQASTYRVLYVGTVYSVCQTPSRLFSVFFPL
ncbi:hypothetical protein M440DRAFT_1240786 [Trichoderma longibrachiatum ATCC 18648]|uniref:Uncharacterized protein n=1 Tax=Trichoderma longibrachiatum ATCC 18648 TaxID=983965 RepID=A0A2T4C648_TRILO|nr:hypothetical protein M440DRAFT_1240786 [Trichoderma longibrachiatum ATCC 18648]